MGFLASTVVLAGRLRSGSSQLEASSGTVLRGPSQSLVPSAKAWSWVSPVPVE